MRLDVPTRRTTLTNGKSSVGRSSMQLGDAGFDAGWSSGARTSEQSNREGMVLTPCLPYKLVLLVLVFCWSLLFVAVECLREFESGSLRGLHPLSSQGVLYVASPSLSPLA